MDPLSVICDRCGVESNYSLEKIRSFKASCISCDFSFKQIALKINKHHQEVENYFSKLEIIIRVEDEFSIEITDQEVEKILTIQNLLDMIYCKNGCSNEIVLHKVLEIIRASGFDISSIKNNEKLFNELEPAKYRYQD